MPACCKLRDRPRNNQQTCAICVGYILERHSTVCELKQSGLSNVLHNRASVITKCTMSVACGLKHIQFLCARMHARQPYACLCASLNECAVYTCQFSLFSPLHERACACVHVCTCSCACTVRTQCASVSLHMRWLVHMCVGTYCQD